MTHTTKTMMNNKLCLDFDERDFLPHQWQFIFDFKHKTVGMSGGLGSGKSVALLYKALLCLLTRPGQTGLSNVGMIYPTYDLGEGIFFEPFIEMLNDIQIDYHPNRSKLYISTAYGKVDLKSAQYPERIVGFTYTDVGIDELDIIKRDKGLKLVTKARERARGRADAQIFTVGSPEGFSTLYEILMRNPNPGTRHIRAKTEDNIYLPSSYIDELKATYDEIMLRAYMNGEFVNMNSKQAHYAFDRNLHVMPVEPPQQSEKLHIGIDFNVDPLCACIGYFREDILYIFKEFALRSSNTYELAELIHSTFPNRIIDVYPDATGDSRKTNAFATDHDILKRAGWDLIFRYGIKQRSSLNIANGDFAHNRVIIDPSCRVLIDDLEQVVTDANGQIDKPKDTKLTHMSDALRNIIYMKRVPKPTMRAA